MRWLAFQIDTTHEASELVTDFLSCLGADGVQVEDAEEIREILAAPGSLDYADEGYLDSLDDVVHITAYFAEFAEGVRCNLDIGLACGDLYDDARKTHRPLAALEELIRSHLAGYGEYLLIGPGYLGWREVKEEDWADGWKKYYQTLHLTDRLVVNPSWIDYQAAPGEIVIALDPGSAFGTGTHETTALCAEIIDEMLLPGARVLDLGTGSGILAIIAAKLGAGAVEAIDIDQLAVNVARTNCELNDVPVNCRQGELQDAQAADYDLIVANIIADVIVQLLPGICAKLAEGGLFIASGIIRDKLGLVLEAAADTSLVLAGRREKGDWCALVFTAG